MGAIAAAIIVLCGAIALLQWHSVQFWVAQVGLTGVGFSLLLDAMGLWLWYQRTPLTRGLGVLASILVLAGPVYWVATPIIDQSARAVHNDTARAANIAALEIDISQRESALARITTGSGGGEWASVIRQTQTELANINAEINRLKATEQSVPNGLNRSYRNLRADLRKYQHAATRGADSIDIVQRAQAELAERRARLAELRAINPSVQAEMRAMIIVAMQVFALLLFQLGAILAINRISVLRATMLESRSPEKKGENVPENIAADHTATPPTPRIAPLALDNPRIEQTSASINKLKAVKTGIAKKSSATPISSSVDKNDTLLLRRACRTLENELTQSGMSPELMAVNLGISPDELRMFLRHQELLAAGERTLSKPVLDKILALYAHTLRQQQEAVD
ncbi:MAG: hypothetical protein AABY83_09385 [Pseudomonadota bacterium]